MQPKLKPGQWSQKYARCKTCGTKDKPHHANGECKDCYRATFQRKLYALRKKTWTPEQWEKRREQVRLASTRFRQRRKRKAKSAK
jgi:hypothetical protein